MRISIPTIPHDLIAASPSTSVSVSAAIERVAAFFLPGNVAVLTGAGVSVDSGIRAYRGKDGRYMNPNYKPILYHEVVDETAKGRAFRQRYWLRSFLGYPLVKRAQPNPTHFALAALQHTSHAERLITQNVDGLHHKAIASVWPPAKASERILELHGSLHKVQCKHGHTVDRSKFQEWLAASNPRWAEFTAEMERTGTQPRTNPDGDVVLEGVSYDDFVVPECPSCALEDKWNDVHKPELVFFGESIPPHVRDRSYRDIDECDRLFIIGTTLATYSAFRLLKHALDHSKPVLMLNVGPTRADTLPHPRIEKIGLPSGVVLREAVKALLGRKADDDPVVRMMLSSGVVSPPAEGDDDRAPRAAG